MLAMTLISELLLLAAFATSTIAGPVPRNNKRQIFTRYSNTTSATQTPISVLSSISLSSTISEVQQSSSVGQQANANTALVIEPIQRTVITHVIPAITFLNPKGEPLATQAAETILSTSFFTPTPAPAPSSSIAASSSVASSSSPTSKSFITSSQSRPIPSLSAPALAAPTSSQLAVQSGPINGTSIPIFTYSPEESVPGSSFASPTPIVTSKAATGNSTGLPGFNHPGSVSQSARPTSSLSSLTAVESSASRSAAQASSLIIPSSSNQPAPVPSSSIRSPVNSVRPTTAPDVTNSTSLTPVVITKTEYTTVYPSSSTLAASLSTAQKPSPSPPQGAELGGISTSAQGQQPIASSSTSSLATLVPTPLAPPPVVIVTQYTTVTPSPTVGQPGASPAPNSPVAPGPVLSSAAPSAPVAQPSSSAVIAPSPALPSAASSPAPSSAAQPASSSQAPAAPVKPSSPAAPSLPPQASSSTTPAAQPPAAPSNAPSAAPSSTSDGPLVITPIAPSQLFTVTVTATQKETVTETATVSVTVRA